MLDEKDLQSIQTMIDASIRASENRMIAYFDTDVMPKFDLLAEGQQAIMKAITPKNEIVELRSEVSLLKLAIRTMNQEIAELKKAQ